MSKMAKLIGKIVVGKIPTKEKALENFKSYFEKKPANPHYDTNVFDNGDSPSFAYSITSKTKADVPWIVCFQGNNGDATHEYSIEMYQHFAMKTGCNLLVCNHSNEPASGDQMVQDAVHNIKLLKAQNPAAEINLYGFSVGGSVAVQAASILKEEGIFNGKVIADRAFSNLKMWLEHTHKPLVPKIFDGIRNFSAFVTRHSGWKMDTTEAAKKLDEGDLITIRINPKASNIDGRVEELDIVTPTDSSLGKSLVETPHQKNEIIASGEDFDHNTSILYLTSEDSERLMNSVIEKANLPTIASVIDTRLYKMIQELKNPDSKAYTPPSASAEQSSEQIEVKSNNLASKIISSISSKAKAPLSNITNKIAGIKQLSSRDRG